MLGTSMLQQMYIRFLHQQASPVQVRWNLASGIDFCLTSFHTQEVKSADRAGQSKEDPAAGVRVSRQARKAVGRLPPKSQVQPCDDSSALLVGTTIGGDDDG